jgi:hypothetical protein
MKESNEAKAVVGVAWYRLKQWQRLRAISTDADNLEDTYEEWLRQAEQKVAELGALGLCVEKVDVDVEQLIAWCNEHGLELDGRARSTYVTEKLSQRGESLVEHRSSVDKA